MKSISAAAFLALATLVVALPAEAGTGGGTQPTTVTNSSRNDNKIFVGINWNFGVRTGVTAVVGYRIAHVSSSDHVTGALIDLTVPLTGAPIQIGEVHLKGIDGTRSVQGELGVGYGFQAAAFLVNGGVRAPYANAGTDYLFGKGWQPYIGVDTLKRVRPHAQTVVQSCPAGDTLLPDGTCSAE